MTRRLHRRDPARFGTEVRVIKHRPHDEPEYFTVELGFWVDRGSRRVWQIERNVPTCAAVRFFYSRAEAEADATDRVLLKRLDTLRRLRREDWRTV